MCDNVSVKPLVRLASTGNLEVWLAVDLGGTLIVLHVGVGSHHRALSGRALVRVWVVLD